jgi:pimeloyl-ACP methyl ester carboxylesterase
MRLSSATLVLAILLTPMSQVALAAPAQPAEQIVVSNGHRIAYHLFPGRQPAIVLDAGGGASSTYWDSLVPQLAKATGSEIITYDRSGFGGSEEVPGPWNVMTARDDLVSVLKDANATRDVVLVSHSLAGEIALYAAEMHPDWFAGAVLVDANVPDFYTEAMIKATMAAYAPIIESLKSAPQSPANRQLVALGQSFEEVSRAFHEAKWPMSVPGVVIVSERTPFEAPAMAEAWRLAHARFSEAAPNRALITAARSSHDVAHDRPDVIVNAVADLVAKVRRKR